MLRKFFFAAILLSATASFGADQERVKRLSERFMCTCGCNSPVRTCPHGLTCPSAVPMKTEIEKFIDGGMSDEQIMAAFADKYGQTVLSAPTTTGFNLAAWIMPFVALAIGTLVAIHFVRQSRSRATAASAAGAGVDTAQYNARLEEELKKYTPED